jgi:hypothetical protein
MHALLKVPPTHFQQMVLPMHALLKVLPTHFQLMVPVQLLLLDLEEMGNFCMQQSNSSVSIRNQPNSCHSQQEPFRFPSAP